MSSNILATLSTIAGIGAESADFLRKNDCKVTIAEPFRAQSAADLQRLLPGIQAVYAGADEFSAELLASSEAAELRIISRWGVGFERIDVDAATAHGIVIAYTPGMLDEAVADYTFALLLGIARRIHTAHASMITGEWAPECGHDVHGKTLGIIGCGRIGTAVARRATGFNLRVLACDPTPNDAAKKLGAEFMSLESLLAQSDFVSLHAAVTPETKGFIGKAQLNLMKPDAYLINTGRGALVDETALAKVLNDSGIAGAAVDTFVEEPLPKEHPFRTAKNLLLAPHQASFSNETGRKVSAACAEAIVDLMHGERPKMVLNPEVFDSPQLRAKLN
jgi:phosphoglycerate dehydrogenase-like enzyme